MSIKNNANTILRNSKSRLRFMRPINKFTPLFAIALGGMLGAASALKNISNTQDYEIMSMTPPDVQNNGKHVAIPVNHLGSQGLSLALFEGRHRKIF